MAKKRLSERAIIDRLREAGFQEVPAELKTTRFYKKLSKKPTCFNQIQRGEGKRKKKQ